MSRSIQGRETAVMLVTCAILFGLAPVLREGGSASHHWWYAKSEMTACRSNLKNISTALEMYSTDYGGSYPSTLSVLTAQYLRQLPTCPAAELDTCSAGYLWHNGPNPIHDCSIYTLTCAGTNHTYAGLHPNEPDYLWRDGLLVR